MRFDWPFYFVIPAKAGIQKYDDEILKNVRVYINIEIPTFVGMEIKE